MRCLLTRHPGPMLVTSSRFLLLIQLLGSLLRLVSGILCVRVLARIICSLCRSAQRRHPQDIPLKREELVGNLCVPVLRRQVEDGSVHQRMSGSQVSHADDARFQGHVEMVAGVSIEVDTLGHREARSRKPSEADPGPAGEPFKRLEG